jgi:hypothetical protein
MIIWWVGNNMLHPVNCPYSQFHLTSCKIHNSKAEDVRELDFCFYKSSLAKLRILGSQYSRSYRFLKDSKNVLKNS